MYAPLPEHMLVVVQPPKAFQDAGLAAPGELWTLHRAVYGLKAAPRAWGKYRDDVLRDMTWKAKGKSYELRQCESDTQVWRIYEHGKNKLLGLLVVYVDDFLVLTEKGGMRTALLAMIRSHWATRDEVILENDNEILFLGLELRRRNGGISLTQEKFIRMVLEKHGLLECKKLTHVQMDSMGEVDLPTPELLRILQAFAGELNWLATRTRADLAYFVSILASAMSKYARWAEQLAKKVFRYLRGTMTEGLFLPGDGDEGSLVGWSDAGYAGMNTKSQSGYFLMWAGAPLLWRSSRQTVSALSTAEAELTSAALSWQIQEGVRV